jgi:hypothetical protein
VTGESLGRVLQRRWYVVLGGAVITLLVCAMVGQSDGLHYRRAEVVFGASDARELIPFAAAVGRLAGQNQGLAFPATRAELHASGVRSGSWIRLVDTGGQWTRINNSPTLIVEAVDPDPARATRLLDEALGRVEGAAAALQIDGSAPSAQRVVPTIQFEESHYVGATRFDAVRAVVVVVGLGMLLTVLAARVVDMVHMGGRYRIKRERG